MDPHPAAPVAGLFGKLPAHGDFVRRGWSDATVDALDRWLSDTIAAAQAARSEADFAAWMHAAPLWRGYVPAGLLGPEALHVAIAPSVDRAGRLFPIAAGVSGDEAAAWRHALSAGAAVDAAIYDALGGQADADATVGVIAGAPVMDGVAEPPGRSVWWLLPDGPPAVESETVDVALLGRLLSAAEVAA